MSIAFRLIFNEDKEDPIIRSILLCRMVPFDEADTIIFLAPVYAIILKTSLFRNGSPPVMYKETAVLYLSTIILKLSKDMSSKSNSPLETPGACFGQKRQL